MYFSAPAEGWLRVAFAMAHRCVIDVVPYDHIMETATIDVLQFGI